jgi:MFS transporter, ACS family, tartrate transporter
MPGTLPDLSAQDAVIRKLMWRLVPVLTLGYLIAYVDRINAGLAALQMNQDLGFSGAEYGIGAGLFYLTYVLFEIPSNLAQARFGGPVWLARIMISWGIASALMLLVTDATTFYGVRLLIGAAEAGFLPGAILYLTEFLPARSRGRVMALFAIAIPMSSLVGSPVSTALLSFDGAFGLRGWQWMFLLESIPAILLGIALPFILPANISRAPWLTVQEKSWLVSELASETGTARVLHGGVWRVMIDPNVWVLGLALGGSAGVSQALALWQPQMIKAFGLTNMEVGMLNGIPFAIGAIAMLLWGRHSDRAGERLWHTILPLAFSALALAATAVVHDLVPFILVICLTLIGTYSMKGPFWALSAEWLAGRASIVGLAWVNSIGNAAVFLTSYSIGVVRDATGSFQLALMPLMAVAALGCVGIAIMARSSAARRPLEPASHGATRL